VCLGRKVSAPRFAISESTGHVRKTEATDVYAGAGTAVAFASFAGSIWGDILHVFVSAELRRTETGAPREGGSA
jgi:hypothetical protein